MNDPFSSLVNWSPDASYDPVDQSFQWRSESAKSPEVAVHNYNNLLQRAAEFYATLDDPYSSKSSSSSSGSDRSFPPTPERRVSSTNIIAELRESIPDKIERRREQNRSSQRAYRQRKDRHQKELEDQIAQWQRKHQALAQSYNYQTEEVSRLKARVHQLNSEISALQCTIPALCGSLSQSPREFDLVPFFDFDAQSQQSTPRLKNRHTNSKERR